MIESHYHSYDNNKARTKRDSLSIRKVVKIAVVYEHKYPRV